MAEASPQDVLFAGKAMEQLMTTGTGTGDQLSFATTSGSTEIPFTTDTKGLAAKASTLYKTDAIEGTASARMPAALRL